MSWAYERHSTMHVRFSETRENMKVCVNRQNV